MVRSLLICMIVILSSATIGIADSKPDPQIGISLRMRADGYQTRSTLYNELITERMNFVCDRLLDRGKSLYLDRLQLNNRIQTISSVVSLTQDQNDRHSDWIMPALITIGTGTIIYMLYSTRGR